jgi:hypothetical protein
MDIDPRSPNPPPSALRRAAGVAALASQHLRQRELEQQQQQQQQQRSHAQQTEEDDEDGEDDARRRKEEAEEDERDVSPARRLASTLGGPRRVPAGAPDAAPRFDETAAGAGFGDEGDDDEEGGSEGEGIASPGGVAARAVTSRTHRLRADLEGMKARIANMANRFE